MRSARIAAAILALAVALTLWLTGQGRGLLHAVIYMLGVLPGIPIGIRLFGRRHPAAWIAGALLGVAPLPGETTGASGSPGNPFQTITVRTSAWPLWPRNPMSADRSLGPTKRPSTPSTAAISSMRSMVSTVSTCTSRQISLSARAA